MRNKIIYLFSLFFIGCASFKITPTLETSVPKVGVPINAPIVISFSQTEFEVAYSRSKIQPFSFLTFKNEIDAVDRYQLFASPIYTAAQKDHFNKPRIDIEITKTIQNQYCHLGDCIIFPKTDSRKIEVSLKVYDSNNKEIFQRTEKIYGERWGNIGVLIYGINPFKELEEKGPGILIQKCLYEFQKNEAFQVFFSQQNDK